MGQDGVTAITFKQVQKLVKQGRVQDSKLVDAVDKLAGVALLVTGAAIDPTALSLLGAKNELTKLGQATAKKLLNRGAPDFLDRSRHLAAAHCLLTYTSFFTALERQLPGLMARIALTDAEKLWLIPDPLLDQAVPLPHPVQYGTRQHLHEELAKSFHRFAKGLNHGYRDRELSEGIQSAIQSADEIYAAQYLELIRDSPDFGAWVARQDQQRIDLGLQELADRIATLQPAAQSDDIAADLSTVYGCRLAEPVFGDGSPADGLVFPTKAEAFVPQAFKLLLNQSADIRLEHEPRWADLTVREDLGPFLLRFLNSPYSTESPLLVLGHPGSGKSLLTEVIAARLAAPAFTVVRVELRDINPEIDFQDQLEAQIKRDTGRTVNWSEFAKARAVNPPLIILDGYDELLQANGKVFADYLMRAHNFQTRESRLGRPVRILITSRITLIDKATLPPDLTVLRLLEFDQPRQELWARTWNAHNSRQFTVPQSGPLRELAEQPLLLLMLAIYDATVRSLADTRELSRTGLYHSLLTEFVRRERRKDPAAPSTVVDNDLNRLGVAAIGMFNRQSVHILSTDLDADLAYLTGATTPDGPGRNLTQAELVVGSFFFIHESRGQVEDAKAYEFLHNTFGEFLAADFLLRQVIRETSTVAKLASDEALRSALDSHLANLSKQWFACLMHVPLHSRPQLVTLLAEWSRGRVDLDALDLILHHQLREIVHSPDAPGFTARHDGDPHPRNALLAHQATYSLNLIVLRVALAEDKYVLDEEKIDSPDLPHGTWDRLAHLWRAWFSIEALSELGLVVDAERQGSTVHVKLSSPNAKVLDRDSPLTRIALAANGLADHVTRGLVALSSDNLTPEVVDFASDQLSRTNVAVPERFTVVHARRNPALLRSFRWPPDELPDHVYTAFDILQRTPSGYELPFPPFDPKDLTGLSRPEAATIIEFMVRFEPRWLAATADFGAAIGPLLTTGLPFAAPLVNAYLDHADADLIAHVAAEVAAAFRPTRSLAAEIAVAFAALGDVGGQPALRQAALTMLVDREIGDDLLLELPQSALDELVRLLVTNTHAELTDLRPAIADRIAAELDGNVDWGPEWLLRQSKVMRICGAGHEVATTLLEHLGHPGIARCPWSTNRVALRAFREVFSPLQVAWVVKNFCDPPDILRTLGLSPLHRYRDELTFQEIDDLLWAAQVAGGRPEHERVLAELREHGLR